VKKLIPLFLISTALFGNAFFNSVSYDITIDIGDSNYVEGFIYDENAQESNIKTYYEYIEFQPTVSGFYDFNNYESILSSGTKDTSLLLYEGFAKDNYLIYDMPWAFNDDKNTFFGGGQGDTFEGGFEETSLPFDASISLTSGQDYTAVFTSFDPNTTGRIQFTIKGPGEIRSNIPEPSSIGFIIGATLLVIALIKRK
jgi:hypothetical protein